MALGVLRHIASCCRQPDGAFWVTGFQLQLGQQSHIHTKILQSSQSGNVGDLDRLTGRIAAWTRYAHAQNVLEVFFISQGVTIPVSFSADIAPHIYREKNSFFTSQAGLDASKSSLKKDSFPSIGILSRAISAFLFLKVAHFEDMGTHGLCKIISSSFPTPYYHTAQSQF